MAASITVTCPNCHKKMQASSEHIGKKAHCPLCKTPFEIRVRADEESLTAVYPAAETAENSTPRSMKRSEDVSPWLSALIGLVMTGLVYFIVLVPLKGTYVGTLFVHGGPVSVANTVITCWGLAALALKYLMVKRQLSYAELELELIPLDIGLQITSANVDQFLAHLGRLTTAQRNSILGRRIQGALEHFKSRNSVPEVQQYLATQAEIDASSVDSGYTMLRSFIWANPILGFVGTVVGISFAVSGLSATFGSGGGSENLMKGLGDVTSGLSTAFDTTLIGLLYAMALLFPTESLRKTEYSMLDRIEGFANDSLLRRLSDERASNAEDMPEIVRDALDATFKEHQRWLAQWQAQVSELGQVVGADFERAVTRIVEKLGQADSSRRQDLTGLSAMFDQLFGQLEQATQSWSTSQRESLSTTQSLTAAAHQLQQSLNEHARIARESVGQPIADGNPSAGSRLGDQIHQLQGQVAQLISMLNVLARDQMDSTVPVTQLDHDAILPSLNSIGPTKRAVGADGRRGIFGKLFGRNPE